MAAVYNQDAGNATLYVDGVAVTSQTSIPHGGHARTADISGQQMLGPGNTSVDVFATALRIGAGKTVVGAEDGRTGTIGFIDEAFVYGTALTVDELDYLYRAAQVRCAGLP